MSLPKSPYLVPATPYPTPSDSRYLDVIEGDPITPVNSPDPRVHRGAGVSDTQSAHAVPATPANSPEKPVRKGSLRKNPSGSSLKTSSSLPQGNLSPWDAAKGATTKNPLVAHRERVRPGNTWDAATANRAVTEVRINSVPRLSHAQN
jgi:hypothetical protein